MHKNMYMNTDVNSNTHTQDKHLSSKYITKGTETIRLQQVGWVSVYQQYFTLQYTDSLMFGKAKM